MSLHSTVNPSDLQSQKTHLEHVPISVVQPTGTGGIHIDSTVGGRADQAKAIHEHKLEEQAAGTSHSYCDWTPLGVNPDVVKMNAPAMCQVKYRNKEITLGQTLLKTETQQQPTLDWPAASVSVNGGQELDVCMRSDDCDRRSLTLHRYSSVRSHSNVYCHHV